MVKYLVEPEPYPIPTHGDVTWGMIMTSTRLWTSEKRGAPEPCAGSDGDSASLDTWLLRDGEPRLGHVAAPGTVGRRAPQGT